MKRILLAGIAALLTLSAASGAMAADKKTLVFVVNGASDFWKNAEAGVKKAQEELPNYTLELKYPEQSAAAYCPVFVAESITFPFTVIVHVTGPLSPPLLRCVISTCDRNCRLSTNSRCHGSGIPLRRMIWPS